MTRRVVGAAGLTLALVLWLGAAGPVWALEDTLTNRRAQAERYERAVPTAEVLETSVLRVARVLPREHRGPFVDFAMVHVDRDAIRDAVLATLTATFTADELAAMADFFGSETGQAIASKMGTYTDRIMPLVMTRVRDAATAYARTQTPGTPGEGTPGEGTPGE